MEDRRNYELEVCRVLHRRLIDERVNPLGLDPMYRFHAEDVRLEPGVDGNEVVMLFRVCGEDRLVGYREAVVPVPYMAQQGNLEYEPPEMRSDDVLTNLVEDFETGSLSEPDIQGTSWVQPRRRRGWPIRPYLA